MPARTFNRVLLPAPLWPIMPTRSPSRICKVRFLRASTSRTGLVDFLYSRRTRNSFRVMRVCWRIRNVRLKLSRWIRAINGSLVCPGLGVKAESDSELENQPALAAREREGGAARDDHERQAGHQEGLRRRDLPFQDRRPDQVEEGGEGVEVHQQAEPPFAEHLRGV